LFFLEIPCSIIYQARGVKTNYEKQLHPNKFKYYAKLNFGNLSLFVTILCIDFSSLQLQTDKKK